MRPAPDRDPNLSATRRAAADEVRSLNAHLRECAEVAVMLARENDARFDRAVKEGGYALELEWPEQKKRLLFARFFAAKALLHLGCPFRGCRRARSCAHGAFCTRGEALGAAEERAAKTRFAGFIRFVSAPESESEQALGGARQDFDSTGRAK